MRMSRGPSLRYEKPRSAWSSCGDDTPRSNRAPLISSTAVVVERLGELVESAMARAHAGSELGQRLGRGVECLGVLVDAEDVDLRVVAQQRGAVPAPAEGRIDDGAGRHHREEFGDLVEHHGTMFESGGVRFVGAHRAPPAISCCPTCSLCR